MSLPDRARAVVTGAASGLGRAFCAQLLQRGATILAADINLEAMERTARELGSDRIHPWRCDVAQISEVEAMADEAERVLGGVDLVINNAGVAAGGDVGDVPIDAWQWIVGINLMGVVHGCHVFTPRFRKRRAGHILNVASAAGLISAPKMAPYNATKAAVVALSESMFAELGGSGVGVSVLCPTFFRTNIGTSARVTGDDGTQGMIDKLMDRSPIQANEVAQIALDGCAKGDFYIVPHRDGRMLWRIKRLSPSGFTRLMPRLLALRSRRS